MKKLIVLLLISFAFTSSSFAQAGNPNQDSSKTANDGSSYEKAIVIAEKTEGPGVKAEYKWIGEHYTNAKVKSQAMSYNNKKPYDIMHIVLTDGKELSLYFDISNFYGKF